MSIREDAIMMLLSGGGGSADVAELTVDANGVYEAISYTNVDGVAVLITDPDTEKPLDGFDPVNVNIDLEAEYQRGYKDGQQDPDPTIVEAEVKKKIDEILEEWSPDDADLGGDGEDESTVIDKLKDYYAKNPFVYKYPAAMQMKIDMEGEASTTDTIYVYIEPYEGTNSYYMDVHLGEGRELASRVYYTQKLTSRDYLYFENIYISDDGIFHFTTYDKPNWVKEPTVFDRAIKLPARCFNPDGKPYRLVVRQTYYYAP